VFANVAFGLRMSRLPEAQLGPRVAEVLALVGLPGFERRDVNTLSGGEQQRVALARSLAPHPELLMLDEPLGSLDRNLRERLVVDLRAILRRMRQTAIYVTHDQEEAFALADRVAVMNAGRIEQMDTPMALYRYPATAFVARFLGLTNLLPARVQKEDGRVLLETPIGRLPAPADLPSGEAQVLIRPDQVSLNGEQAFQLEGVIRQQTFRGSTCRTVIDFQGTQLVFDFPATTFLPGEGETIRLGFDPQAAIQVFLETAGRIP
jgi:ABC-type Fe3+/spermidine/putrescine transport system ATPase subunit